MSLTRLTDGADSRRPALSWLAAVALGSSTGLTLSMAVLAGGVTPLGTQPGLEHAMLPPGDCASCHGDYEATLDLEPWNTWAGSMMANAGRDPIFWAALDVANNDLPGVGDFCLRCHVPTAWLAGRSEPPAGSVDGCGLDGNLDEPDNDFQGVSCHLCHRMYVNPIPPDGEDPIYHENAQFWIDDADCPDGNGPCRRGPYDYPADGTDPPGQHPWAYSAYHETSDICGTCHNVTSPALTLIDEQGDDTGVPFPIERTYMEWTQSAFAEPGPSFVACQGCHMPDQTDESATACQQGQNDRAGDLPTHKIVGGNSWVPRVLRDEYPALGRSGELDNTIAAALDLLQNQSANLELTIDSFDESTGALALEVRTHNLTGHKLPTGYTEGRRMWLNLVVRDGEDSIVFESGAYDDLTGELANDPQAKVYRSERGIWNRHGTEECDTADALGEHAFHFVLDNCIAIDNRIPPAGFTGGENPETRPVNYTYPETSEGSGILVSYDDTAYQVTVPKDTPAPLTVEATLYYQTTSKEYVEFLRDQAVDGSFPNDCTPRSTGTPSQSRGELLYDLWAEHDRSPPVALASATAGVTAATIFADGFESGDVSAWSAVVP